MEPVTEQLGLDVVGPDEPQVDSQQPAEHSLETHETGTPTDLPTRWFFLTNRQNLLEVLSAGLVAPSDTYAKYYDDLLALAPGRVPLWSGPPPSAAIDAVVDAENPGSFPVAVELNGLALRGPVLEIGDSRLLAADAVIPTGDVKVYVRSQRELTELTTQEHENIDHKRVGYDVSPEKFAGGDAGTGPLDWLRGLDPGQDRTKAARRADAVTGALALVAQALPARPDSWRDYSRLLQGSDSTGEGQLPIWLTVSALKGVRPAGADVDAVLFSAAAEVLADGGDGRPSAVIEQISQAAKTGKAGRGIPKAVEAGLAWVSDVLALKKEFTDGKPTTAARAIAAALLRPEPKRLLGFADGKQDPASYIAAAALVGLRSGRRRLAIELRPAPLDDLLAGLAAALCDGREHPAPASVVIDGETLSLESDGRNLMTVTIQAPSVSEVLAAADLTTGRGKIAALELARRLEWSDCIENELILPGREFEARYDNKRQRMVIGFRGFPSIERRLIPDVFLARLAHDPIPEELAREVLEQFSDAGG